MLRRIGPKPDALPGIAAINHADDLRQAGRAAFELQQPVRCLAKPLVVNAVAGLFRKVGHIQHVVLNQIIEEVSAERHVRDEAFVHGHDLAHNGGAADLGKRDGNAQRRTMGAPATGTDQHESAIIDSLEPVELPNQPGDRIAALLRHRCVLVRDDVNDPAEGLLARHADYRAMCGQEVGMGCLHGERHPANLAPDLKRAALQQVDAIGAVAKKVEGELDVHRVLID